MIKKITSLLIIVIISIVAIYYFAPGLWTKIEKTYREKAGWTEDAKKNQPVKYLNYVLSEASVQYDKIDSYISDYQNAIIDLKGKRDKSKRIYEYDVSLLNDMKKIYNRTTSWPVEFKGEAYSETEFKEQINILLNERDTHQRIVNSLQSEIKNIHDKVSNLKSAKAKYMSELSEIKANLAIAKASQGTKSIENFIKSADNVLSYVGDTSKKYQMDTPIRGAEELVNESQDNNKSSQSVESFLNN